jgi:glycosyltransferase involved in cell wall biosynthesis
MPGRGTAAGPTVLTTQHSAAPAPPRVFIILATYNGAAFLPEQLASIAAQDHPRWILLWRDDGSLDETRAMMHGFTAAQPQGQVEQVVATDAHLGAAGSFMVLLAEAASRMEPGDLLAFADQDDVWLPGKLSRAIAAVMACPPERPTLYSARQVLVDAQLRRIALSVPVRPPPGFPACLTQNLATGCTVLMNRAAALLVAASTRPAGCQHDWWTYIVVTAAGGRFLIDDEAVVLYRQHQGNLVGAPRSMFRRAVAALRRGPALFMALLRQNVAALEAQSHILTPEARGELECIRAGLSGGPLRRWRALRRPGLRRQTWAEQVLFRIWFMFG